VTCGISCYRSHDFEVWLKQDTATLAEIDNSSAARHSSPLWHHFHSPSQLPPEEVRNGRKMTVIAEPASDEAKGGLFSD